MKKWVVNFFDGDTILDVVDTREQAFEVARAFYMREAARGEISLKDALEYIQVLENDNNGIGIAIYEEDEEEIKKCY